MIYDIPELQSQLKKILKPKRYRHSIAVMYTAQCLAMKHGYPLEEAGVAGLLHDCAKNMSDDELLKVCKKNNIEITEHEYESPFLLHGKVGAHIARHEYEIDNEEILDSIRWHTVGKPNMSTLGKIIYIADYIEPNRKPLPRFDFVRKESFTDLNKACAYILEDQLQYFKDSGKNTDPNSSYAYEYYKQYIEGDCNE